MAMGFVDTGQDAATLDPFLSVSDVDGQIVHTLTKDESRGTRPRRRHPAWVKRVLETALGEKIQ
jgi:hypothetical protein